MSTYMTGEAAATATGRTVAVVDAAAATGVIPAESVGWQLLVDVALWTEPPAPPRKAPTKKAKAVGQVEQVASRR